ncbi:MAG: 1-(5-phosphoribosyl)-5-[(5-phosphoribosylamino)methylideneamino]imidazole-4-carboxamide isomerase [Synechococcaceae bacterium WB4_1_0192]|jgi:phosphoribosylformimino-5-aminoimidazole carboxamide ribotide isomerase|nr:1-(5-phosphoribosyl)-5-[(5-phosphoribosylamino)methylideneamino]imidazole-4-carboxamide isomerase [Synechococcaceae bacterium WB4_1_0192]
MKLPQRWTAQPASHGISGGYRHFQLLGEQGKGPERAARLEAVLERGVRLVVPLRDLRDRRLWQPGWQSLRATAAMQIIPAIDLLDGQCVRLHQGDYDQVTRFSSDPVAQALDWQRQGAERLHLVDLDGARTGQPVNDQVIKAITAALSIPVQLGGGVRSAERAEELLASGLDRVILGTVAIEKPDLVDALASRHPGRVVVGIDAKDGLVATRGWIETSTVQATDLARRFAASGVAAIISTDIATDGTLAGPNLEALRAMAEASSVPVIASGGIGTLEDILSLLTIAPLGVNGVIVGRALYDGTVNLGEALQAVGPERVQDALTSPKRSITV